MSNIQAQPALASEPIGRLQKDSFRLRRDVVRPMLSLGMTSFLSQISIVCAMAAVLNMCRRYGAQDPIYGQPEYAQIPTAVIGIVMKFFQIVISVAVGLAAGCIPIAGYNVGARRGDRAVGLMKRLMWAEALVGLAATLFFELFPQPLCRLFGAANESVYYTEFALRCIRWLLCALPFACVNKGAFIFLQSIGKPVSSTLLSLLREIVGGVGLVLLLPCFFGLNGILYFMAAAELMTFAAVLPVLRTTAVRLRRLQPQGL